MTAKHMKNVSSFAKAPTLGAVVLCRLDSKRLPGKVLIDIHGHPLLWYVLERCRHVEALDHIVVATTARPVDDSIVEYCEQEHVDVFRGNVNDVAQRVLGCARQYNMDYFARINGDSPFCSPTLLNQAWHIARTQPVDIVTNLVERSFPYGVSVEIFRTAVFEAGYHHLDQPRYQEHSTLFFYENIDNYRHYNIRRAGDNLSDVRLTVDTPQDLETFRAIVAASSRAWSEIDYQEAVALKRECEKSR